MTNVLGPYMRSAKSGATAADRRLLAAATVSAVPTLATDGFAVPKAEHIHTLPKVSGGAGLTVSWRMYVWYDVAGAWFGVSSIGTAGLVVSTFAQNKTETVQVSGGPDRIAYEIAAFDVGATLDLWAGVSGT